MAAQLRSAQRRFDLLRSTVVQRRFPLHHLIVVSAGVSAPRVDARLGICVTTSLDLAEPCPG
jgi:hypothetical protein